MLAKRFISFGETKRFVFAGLGSSAQGNETKVALLGNTRRSELSVKVDEKWRARSSDEKPMPCARGNPNVRVNGGQRSRPATTKSGRAAARSDELNRIYCAKQRLLSWPRGQRQLDEFRSPACLCDRNFERLHGWRAVGFWQRSRADQYSHGRQVRVRAIVPGRLLPALRRQRLAMGSETLVQLSRSDFDQHELHYPPIRHIHHHSEPYACAF